MDAESVPGGAVTKAKRAKLEKAGYVVSDSAEQFLDEIAPVTLAQKRIGLVGNKAERFFKARALEVTGVMETEILARAHRVLLNGLKQDKTERQLLEELDQELGDYIPETDAAGRVVNLPQRIETIARTNVSEAVNEGRYATFTDPDLQGFVTAFQYTAVMDDRVRENHAAWDGVVREVNDPVWFGPPDRRPLNGYNCRCLLVPVTLIDEVEITPDDEMPTVEVSDAGFE